MYLIKMANVINFLPNEYNFPIHAYGQKLTNQNLGSSSDLTVYDTITYSRIRDPYDLYNSGGTGIFTNRTGKRLLFWYSFNVTYDMAAGATFSQYMGIQVNGVISNMKARNPASGIFQLRMGETLNGFIYLNANDTIRCVLTTNRAGNVATHGYAFLIALSPTLASKAITAKTALLADTKIDYYDKQVIVDDTRNITMTGVETIFFTFAPSSIFDKYHFRNDITAMYMTPFNKRSIFNVNLAVSYTNPLVATTFILGLRINGTLTPFLAFNNISIASSFPLFISTTFDIILKPGDEVVPYLTSGASTTVTRLRFVMTYLKDT